MNAGDLRSILGFAHAYWVDEHFVTSHHVSEVTRIFSRVSIKPAFISHQTLCVYVCLGDFPKVCACAFGVTGKVCACEFSCAVIGGIDWKMLRCDWSKWVT